ncbi:MAG: winged helix-turn-helix domain-containing protein [Chthoniobacteraceae bacterium]
MRRSALHESEPVYQQLARRLEELIQSRSLRAGDRMPSVRDFSTQQRVSVPTALQAYVTLETRGLIEARPKSGFYVRARQADLAPPPMKSPTPPKSIVPREPDPAEALLADHSNTKLVPFGAALPSPRSFCPA